MRRSTVVSLPLQLVFPGSFFPIYASVIVQAVLKLKRLPREMFIYTRVFALRFCLDGKNQLDHEFAL